MLNEMTWLQFLANVHFVTNMHRLISLLTKVSCTKYTIVMCSVYVDDEFIIASVSPI